MHAALSLTRSLRLSVQPHFVPWATDGAVISAGMVVQSQALCLPLFLAAQLILRGLHIPRHSDMIKKAERVCCQLRHLNERLAYKNSRHCSCGTVGVWLLQKQSVGTVGMVSVWISCRATSVGQMSPRVLFYFWILLSVLMGVWQWDRCSPPAVVCSFGLNLAKIIFIWFLCRLLENIYTERRMLCKMELLKLLSRWRCVCNIRKKLYGRVIGVNRRVVTKCVICPVFRLSAHHDWFSGWSCNRCEHWSDQPFTAARELTGHFHFTITADGH